MAAKRGKRKASTSPDCGALAGSSNDSAQLTTWSIEDAKKALSTVKLTLEDEGGVRKVGKNSLAEAIHGSTTSGKVRWSNVLRRDCQLPLPEPSKFLLEGSTQKADVFHPCQVPEAVNKLLGLREGQVWFQNASFVSEVKNLMTKCGSPDFSKLDAVVEAVRVQSRQRDAELAAFQVPALRDGFSQMRLHKNVQGRVLLAAHDEIKWLGLDEDGKHNEWTNWLRSALEEYIEGYHHSLNSRSDDTPCLEYVKLEGESIPTPMIDKLCFQKVILLCIGKSKLAGEHAEKALDIYGRHIVGDSRLDAERAANASAAPNAAKDFVLGPAEAARQERPLSAELVTILRDEVSLEFGKLARNLSELEMRLQGAAESQIQRTGSTVLAGVRTFVLEQLAQFADWRISLRTTFDDAISAARNSGFLQIGRQAGGSGSHLRVQDELLAACRQIPADQFEMFRRSGDMLCVSTFLEETFPVEQQYIIRHFMPTFSTALKTRKLQEAGETGERPWIAWKEGAWRIVYTEADRTTMLLLLQEDLWQRRLRDLLTMHPPPRNGSRAPQSGGLRGGPYSRPQAGGSSHVNAANVRAFFGSAPGPPDGGA